MEDDGYCDRQPNFYQAGNPILESRAMDEYATRFVEASGGRGTGPERSDARHRPCAYISGVDQPNGGTDWRSNVRICWNRAESIVIYRTEENFCWVKFL